MQEKNYYEITKKKTKGRLYKKNCKKTNQNAQR